MPNNKKILVLIPYSFATMENAPKVRAYNMYNALKSVADPIFVIGTPSGLINLIRENKSGIPLPKLQSRLIPELEYIIKKQPIDYVYIESLAASLFSFDYFFLNCIKKRGIPIFPFIRDLYWKYKGTLQESWRQKIWFKHCDKELAWYQENATGLLFPSQYMANSINFRKKDVLSPAGDPSRCLNPYLPDNENITFVGGISKKMGVEILANAMKYVVKEYPHSRCNIVGNGDSETIKRLKGLDFINFLPDKNYFDIPEILAQSYITVIPHPNIPHNDFAIPVKLFDYMSSGRPVVSTDCPSMTDFIKENDIGIITTDNPKNLAEGIIYLLDNPDVAQKYGNNALCAIKEKHSWQHRARTLINIMDDN